MGKRYHCNYCDKTMVAAPSIVKTHNKGIVHQKCVQEHYHQFKSAETILAEESVKKPCSRFAKGECSFGRLCHYSHYTADQLNELRQMVASKEESNTIPEMSYEELFLTIQNERSAQQSSNQTVLYDNNGITHIFPWSYNTVVDTHGNNLPPSLRKFKIEDFSEVNFTNWGS